MESDTSDVELESVHEYSHHSWDRPTRPDNPLPENVSPEDLLRSMWQFAGLLFLLEDGRSLLRLPQLASHQLEHLLIDPALYTTVPPYSEFVHLLPHRLLEASLSLAERCIAFFRYFETRLMNNGYEGRLETIGTSHDGYTYYYLGHHSMRLCRESDEQQTWETVATDTIELESFLSSGALNTRRRLDRPILEFIDNDVLPQWRAVQRKIDRMKAMELAPRKRSQRLQELEETKKREEEEARLRQQQWEQEMEAHRKAELERLRAEESARSSMKVEAGEDSGSDAAGAPTVRMDRMEQRRLDREARRIAFEERKLQMELEKLQKQQAAFESRFRRELRRDRWKVVWAVRRQFHTLDVDAPEDLSPEEYDSEYESPSDDEVSKLIVRVPNYNRRKKELHQLLKESKKQRAVEMAQWRRDEEERERLRKVEEKERKQREKEERDREKALRKEQRAEKKKAKVGGVVKCSSGWVKERHRQMDMLQRMIGPRSVGVKLTAVAVGSDGAEEIRVQMYRKERKSKKGIRGRKPGQVEGGDEDDEDSEDEDEDERMHDSQLNFSLNDSSHHDVAPVDQTQQLEHSHSAEPMAQEEREIMEPPAKMPRLVEESQ
jgi:hypothetical protein